MSLFYWKENPGGLSFFWKGWLGCVSEDRVLHDTSSIPCFQHICGGQHHTCCPQFTRWPCCDGSGSVLKLSPKSSKRAQCRHKVLVRCAGRKLPQPMGWMELVDESLDSCPSREDILWYILHGSSQFFTGFPWECDTHRGRWQLSAVPVTGH